jgi:hypothetical protein
MDKAKRKRLETKGWKTGTAEEFLDDISTPATDLSVVQLIEEARNDLRDIADHGALLWAGTITRLVNALGQQATERQKAEAEHDDLQSVSELCSAEIAKRQELDCRVFALEARLNEVEQINAAVTDDWLALCGLRERFIEAQRLLIITADYDVNDIACWCYIRTTNGKQRAIEDHDVQCRQARSIAYIDPPPENVKYQGSWAWALEQMKAGKRVTNDDTDGYYCLDYYEASAGAERHLSLYSMDGTLANCELLIGPEDFESTSWRLIEDTPTGEE